MVKECVEVLTVISQLLITFAALKKM